MLTEICQYLRNWFERHKLIGDFVVTDGIITTADGVALSFLSGQYYRIIGSVMNDGVHRHGEEILTDEPQFSGAVWFMAIPPAFLSLVDEITAWTTDHAEAINSPYNSESFGGYSYTVRNSGSGTDGESSGITWQNQFKARLAPWRKI